MTTLAEALDAWNSDKLQKYVYLLDGGSKLTRKAERLSFIRQKMLDKNSVQILWRKLDETAQRAVSAAYHNDGEFDTGAFVAQYGQLPERPGGNDPWRSWYYQEPIPFDLFLINGRIPDDLLPKLADLVLPVDRFQLEGTDELPQAIALDDVQFPIIRVDTELIGRTDLLTFLRLVEQDAINYGSTNHRLTAGSVRKVMANLLAGDFRGDPEKLTGRYVIRPFGLDVFTQESGLVTRTGKLTSAGKNYLQTQDSEILLQAFEKWTEKGSFDELTRIHELRGLRSRNTRLTPPASRRTKIIEALSWCPTSTWISLYDFYRAIKIWHFGFDIEATEWSNLYAGAYRDYGYMGDGDYWQIVNGLYINAVIWEYLGTIGAVDLAYTSEPTNLGTEIEYVDDSYSLYDDLLFFRINNWGAYLLGQADQYESLQIQRGALFTIDTALRVHTHIQSNLQPSERLLLERISDPLDEQTYQLNTEKLLTAVESGQKLEHLLDFLQKNHQGALPPPVAEWLARLKRNQGVFKEQTTAVLIQLKRADLQQVIEQDETLSKLSRPVDNKTILVLSAHLPRFRRRLKELGYLMS